MRAWGIAVACVIGGALAAPARAEPPPDGQAAASHSSNADGLDAGDPARLAHALAALGAEGDHRAVRAIAGRIERGLPTVLLRRAIDALVATGRREIVRVLVGLASHREPSIRVRVAEALGEVGAPIARRVLAELLDDRAREVRTTAARVIRELGARPVMDPLILAARRGLPEAALAVGEQATPMHVRRFLRELDPGSLDELTPTVRILLIRHDLPRAIKLAVLARTAQIPGSDTEHLLREVAAGLPRGDAVREALEEAVSELRSRATAEVEP